MIRTVLAGLILLGMVSFGRPDDHGEDCPSKCTPCTQAIKKALDYLASKQSDDGSVLTEKVKGSEALFKSAGDVMTTALAGLAFMAEGSTPSSGAYKSQQARLRDYLYNVSINKIPKKKINGDAWPAALGILYFANLYEKDKDEKSKEALKVLVEFLSAQQSDKGGWSLGNMQGGKTEDMKHLTAGVNLCIIALARAKSVGIEVDEKVFERSRTYYEKTLNSDGSFKYALHDNREPRQGRSIIALLDLMLLGVDKDSRYEKAFAYARKNADKVMTHHMPQFHTMLGAYTFYYLGKDDWKKFVQTYYAKIISRQKEDGSVAAMWDVDKKLMMTVPWNDLAFGPTYSTANFALILQTPQLNVRLK